jgi:hypothetical protein
MVTFKDGIAASKAQSKKPDQPYSGALLVSVIHPGRDVRT